MAQTSYNIHIQRALKAIAERFQNELAASAVTQTGPLPKYINDLFKKVNVDTNIVGNTGPNSIIDVQPDYRMIILSITFYIVKEYPDMDIKPYPTLTPVALMAYNLALLYIFALVNDDANIRYVKSKYSREISTTRHLDRILAKFRTFPVPPYLMQLIQALQAGYDERKENLRYVNSLACFDLDYDFGRTPPIMIYLIAHNLIASRPGNANPDDIFAEWVNTQIMNAPRALYVNNYLGTHEELGVYTNWFSQSNRMLFNPVTNRTLTVRPTFMRSDTMSQAFNVTTENINPYIHLLGLDTNNRSIIEADLTATSKCIENTYPNCPTIGSLAVVAKNSNILNHYYSNIALPTWHSIAPRARGVNETHTRVSAITFADRINYKATGNYSFNSTVKFPATESAYDPPLYLAENKAPATADIPIVQKLFDDQNDIQPDVRHFCPFETSNENIFSNVITGRTIETEEITSCAVPQPNPRNSILTENCFFLESAIPISHVTPINSQPNSSLPIVVREFHSSKLPAVRIDLIDRSIDRLPRFAAAIHGDIANGLPGYDMLDAVPHPQHACNSISYTIDEGPAESMIDKDLRKVRAWSSYRYYNLHQSDNVPIRNRKLMLLNFRTLHGTNVPLVETPHPSICIPKN